MSKQKHEENNVIRSLMKKNDIRVNGNEILILNGEGRAKKQDDLGKGSWGKIDFLTNHCGYHKLSVRDF